MTMTNRSNINFEDIPNDVINAPEHYKKGGIETIDYIKAKTSNEQFEGYLLGNVFKYLSRYQFKNGEEDLKKGKWYIEKLLEFKELEKAHEK